MHLYYYSSCDCGKELSNNIKIFEDKEKCFNFFKKELCDIIDIEDEEKLSKIKKLDLINIKKITDIINCEDKDFKDFFISFNKKCNLEIKINHGYESIYVFGIKFDIKFEQDINYDF